MTDNMIDKGLAIGPVLLALGVGAALGFAYFSSLRRNVDLYVGKAPLWRSAGLQVLRFVMLAAAFVLIARAGAIILLSALLGLLLARTVMLRRWRPR